MEEYHGPRRRAELLVKDRLMEMGWERRRQELQKRVEAGRRDAIVKCADGASRTIFVRNDLFQIFMGSF